MRGKNHYYREPLLVDEYGLYVTVAQMGFFLNRPRAKAKFQARDLEFLNYLGLQLKKNGLEYQI